MATQIFVKQNGDYFAGEVDMSEQIIDGVREQGCWIERIDHLEPIGFFNILRHWLFPEKEFHAIIAKGNKIHEIEADW